MPRIIYSWVSRGGWCSGWHWTQASSTPPQSPKSPKSPKQSPKNRWTGKWEPLASSQAAWLQQTQPTSGEASGSQEECSAAEQVILCQKEIDALSTLPMFNPIRNLLYEQMAAAQAKAAIDKRTTPTQRLLTAERWLAREQKRMAWDKEKQAELVSWIDERQVLIDKELAVVATLRAEVGAPESSSHAVERTQPDDMMDVCDMTVDNESWRAFQEGVHEARAQEDPIVRQQMEASLVLKHVPHAPQRDADHAKGYGKGKAEQSTAKPAPYDQP